MRCLNYDKRMSFSYIPFHFIIIVVPLSAAVVDSSLTLSLSLGFRKLHDSALTRLLRWTEDFDATEFRPSCAVSGKSSPSIRLQSGARSVDGRNGKVEYVLKFISLSNRRTGMQYTPMMSLRRVCYVFHFIVLLCTRSINITISSTPYTYHSYNTMFSRRRSTLITIPFRLQHPPLLTYIQHTRWTYTPNDYFSRLRKYNQ